MGTEGWLHLDGPSDVVGSNQSLDERPVHLRQSLGPLQILKSS